MSRYIPTGNEYISIPTIRQDDGAIESLNVVLMKLDGLLEICGTEKEPLISCPAMEAEKGKWSWAFREDWIPVFEGIGGKSKGGMICAPPGEQFFFYRAPSSAPGFRICLGHIYQTANIRHRLPNWTYAVRRFGWCYQTGVMVDIFAGTLLTSFAFFCPGKADYSLEGENGKESLEWGREVTGQGPIRLRVDCESEPILAVGANLSSVGAMSAALEVHRVPADEWLVRTEEWLRARRVAVPHDAALEMKANRNGHFARFFAMAKTIDTGEVVSMTSRSHRYYVSSAYWDRDSLLWLFPFLVRNDKSMAEGLLRYAFGRQLTDAGIHSRYISGRPLEFGFELDELLAPLIALGAWNRIYPEDAIWEEQSIREGVVSLFRRLRKYRREPFGLYWTELMPTDDRVEGGRDMLTYDNALVIHACEASAAMLDRISPELARFARVEVPTVSAAIRKHLVKNGLFAWGMDPEGNTEVYDEAAGSLLLLPYYGFCRADETAYKNTVQHFYSAANPYCLKGNFSELGNRHTDKPHPWVLSACNSILSGVRVKEGLDFLRRAPMDNGIACESVNIETGEPETGLHFATCAGFVAHSIVTGTARAR